MKKTYAIRYDIPIGGYSGPAAFSMYPDGVELVQPPAISVGPRSTTVNMLVRCEPQIGRDMCWIPLEKPDEPQ